MPYTPLSIVALVLMLILTIQTDPFDRLRRGLTHPVRAGFVVAWVGLGGTIASLRFEEALDAVLSINEMCDHYGLHLPDLNVTHIDDAMVIDSTEFRLAIHANALLESINLLDSQGVTHVLLTAGTDQMDNIVAFLDRYAPPQIAIVVTGSMESADSPDGDGRDNIIFANTILQYLTEALVLVAFNQQCFHGCDLVKIDAQSKSGITCDEGALIYPCPSEPLKTIPQALAANCKTFMPRDPPPLEDDWAVLHKFGIGASACPKYIPEAMRNHGYGALIIESLGDCNLPAENDDFKTVIREVYDDGFLIVQTSKVTFTQVVQPAYAGGQAYDEIQLGYRTLAATCARLQYIINRGRIKEWSPYVLREQWDKILPGDILIDEPARYIRGGQND